MNALERALLTGAATVAIGAGASVAGAVPAQADPWSDACVYVCIFEHVGFGGNMSYESPAKASLAGSWWNDQTSSIASKTYTVRFYQHENGRGCSVLVPANSSNADLRNPYCADPDPQINMNDEISSWYRP